jgi:hypothetical protein
MSRSRRPAPLPGDLPEAVRILLTELRGMKEASGHDLRTLARETHGSRSSWGRWLSGETWIPVDAVMALAALCDADARRLRVLWEVADEARRSSPAAATPPDGPAAEPPPTRTVGSPSAADAPPSPATEPAPAGRRPRPMFLGALIGCTLLAGTAGVALGAALQTASEPESATTRPVTSGAAARPPVKAISRRTVLARARTWHPGGPERVPYDQSASHQGYRTDGSGYASMALGLPKPGPNSAALESSYCRHIPSSQLRPGDLVIKSSGGAGVREVVIFDRWTGRDRAAYWAYQQRRGYGTDHLVLRAGLASGSGHHGCRPYHVREDQVG